MSQLLAGPIVRRIELTAASVWLASRVPHAVELIIYDKSGDECLRGQAHTVPLGAQLHVAAVTAATGPGLAWGQLYEYEVTVDGVALDVAHLLYNEGPARLSFVTFPQQLTELSILHGSCRHPCWGGRDALDITDERLADSVGGSAPRPQALILTGDSIYADSPSTSLLALATAVGDQLLGWSEQLPGVDATSAELGPRSRRAVAREVAHIPQPTQRQAFGLGELYALHLLSMSQELWPAEVPTDLRNYHRSLPAVQRALANIATYAIFDDHEVTDDWNLTRQWCDRVLGTTLGRRMVRNGLAAFAVMQAWGNQPSQFTSGNPGAHILQELCTPAPADEPLATLLAIPEQGGTELTHPSGALPWHFEISCPCADLRALDTRTMRAFPGEVCTDPPELLSRSGFEQQLPPIAPERVQILIAPTPVAPPPRTGLERAVTWLSNGWKARGADRAMAAVYLPDYGDLWLPHLPVYRRLLDRLPRRSVLLSGDTHFGYAARIHHPGGTAAVFVSSGLLRETLGRRWRHAIGYAYPWPVPRRPPTLDGPGFRIQYIRAAGSGLAGRDYVGRNNLGELRFEQHGEQLVAQQRLWWRRSDRQPAGPWSVFRAPMN